jgi:hypothetical protein
VEQPIPDPGRRSLRRTQAEAEAEAAFSDYRSALLELALPAVRDSIRAARVAFETGQASFLTVIEAEFSGRGRGGSLGTPLTRGRRRWLRCQRSSGEGGRRHPKEDLLVFVAAGHLSPVILPGFRSIRGQPLRDLEDPQELGVGRSRRPRARTGLSWGSWFPMTPHSGDSASHNPARCGCAKQA